MYQHAVIYTACRFALLRIWYCSHISYFTFYYECMIFQGFLRLFSILVIMSLCSAQLIIKMYTFVEIIAFIALTKQQFVDQFRGSNNVKSDWKTVNPVTIIVCTTEHTHTHTHTHVGFYGLRGLSIGVMVFILYKLYVLLPYTYPTPKLSPHRRRCISTFPQKNTHCMIYKHFKLWGHWKCPHKSPSPCNTYVIPMSLYKFVSS